MDPESRGDDLHLPELLLTMLVCPVDRGNLYRSGEALICTVCGRHYLIRDGIPIMIVEETESER